MTCVAFIIIPGSQAATPTQWWCYILFVCVFDKLGINLRSLGCWLSLLTDLKNILSPVIVGRTLVSVHQLLPVMTPVDKLPIYNSVICNYRLLAGLGLGWALRAQAAWGVKVGDRDWRVDWSCWFETFQWKLNPPEWVRVSMVRGVIP